MSYWRSKTMTSAKLAACAAVLCMSVFGQALHLHQHVDSQQVCNPHHPAGPQHVQSRLACECDNPFERHRQRTADISTARHPGRSTDRSLNSHSDIVKSEGAPCRTTHDSHHHGPHHHGPHHHDGDHCGICLILGQCAPTVALADWCEFSDCVAIVDARDECPIRLTRLSPVARGPPSAPTLPVC